MSFKQFLVNSWYSGAAWLTLLQPISWLFKALVTRRYIQFVQGERSIVRHPVPVIVVGNITVGGTGKTPLVIYLVEQLRQAGFHPGVISRGYGGDATEYPLLVNRSSDVKQVGDEPHLIVQRTGIPMVIDPNRPAAIEHLLKHYECDLIISDDGLQHYQMARDIEIVVIDGKRGFGNGRCLPAGPLREPLTRLSLVDFVVVNGDVEVRLDQVHHDMTIMPKGFHEVSTFHPYLGPALKQQVHGVAGIGNPNRFFDQLRRMGYDVIEHTFADHHAYTLGDFEFDDGVTPILMTEKDAVKCHAIGKDNWYFLKIDVELGDQFLPALIDQIHQSPYGKS